MISVRFVLSVIAYVDGLLSSLLDSRYAGCHLIALNRILISSTEGSATRRLNVYTDGSVSAASQLVDLVSLLQTAVADLSCQYPDIQSLVNIQAYCRKLLGFKAGSPIMKLAAGLEALLGELSGGDDDSV